MGSSGFYIRLQQTADRLIKKYGAQQTVRHEQQGPYDPGQGQSAVTEITYQIAMVTYPYEQRFINETTIRSTDLWGYFTAKGITTVPQQGDKLDHTDGNTYSFLVVKPLNPGGVVLEYECQLRKG